MKIRQLRAKEIQMEGVPVRQRLTPCLIMQQDGVVKRLTVILIGIFRRFVRWVMTLIAMDPATTPKLQNIQSSLVSARVSGAPSGIYWSSTEDSVNPTQLAYFQSFVFGAGNSQGSNGKNLQGGVRCVRGFN
ncbi:protein of unknown function [Legionella fallonii LLAP-10]|uniref:Uncharacterized protein n=1 Tax=Legionella fallonii LLAP-10 TaxID=1212491 RepID=A0A098G8U4_9GAMM|nr:protein of unknown function [Legionella fallonii LLAP-10]